MENSDDFTPLKAKEFERDWTFFVTTAQGAIFPVKDWKDFQKYLSQCGKIKVQARMLNNDGGNWQFEVKCIYGTYGTPLWGVGETGPWGEDFVRRCLGYSGEIDDFSDCKFSLPLPVVKPASLSELSL